MTADDIRREVLDAVQRGDIPRGGPSELAARDLIDDCPAGYWQRYIAEATARIREQAARPNCTCADGGRGGDRCDRCWGWRS